MSDDVENEHLYRGHTIQLVLGRRQSHGWTCSYRVVAAVEKGRRNEWHGEVTTVYNLRDDAKQAALQQAQQQIDLRLEGQRR
jgi:hypothetical protein